MTSGGNFVPQERRVHAQDQGSFTPTFRSGSQQDQIAHSCSIGQATVPRYWKEQQQRLSWPLPDDCDDDRLGQLLFPTRPARRIHSRPCPILPKRNDSFRRTSI